MSVKRSGSWFSQSRVDTRDLKSIDSSVQGDFDSLLAAFATNLDPTSGIAYPYVLRGFKIGFTNAIGSPANTLTMTVANSGIFQGASLTSGTFYLTDYNALPEVLDGNTNSGVVSGSFAASTTNYIGIDYTRQLDPATADIVYFWDVASDSQFSRVVPLARTLNYVITISTLPFTDPSQAHICPIAQVVTDANNNVTSIEDARPLMFALGRGGQVPDLAYVYPWAQGRSPNGTTESSTNPTTNVFDGGDKSIGSLKELIDAILSQIKEIQGTPYWSSPAGGSGGGGSIVNLREDAVNTVITGSGSVMHDEVIPGLTAPGRMNWSSNINLKLIGSALTYSILANPATTDITLADNQVAYINLVRGVAIAPNLIYTNGSPVVTSVGAASWTTLLLPGDFIRVTALNDSYYYQILTVDSASQVTLTANYAQPSSSVAGDPSVYAYGSYQTASNAQTRVSSRVQVAARGSVPFTDNVYWLFLRADNGSGTPRVYARFFGEELLQGESQQIGEGISDQNLAFMGATSPADSSPSYSTQTLGAPTTGNEFVGNGESLTKAIHTLDVEANVPLRPHANVGTANQNLYFENSSVTGGDGTTKTVGPLNGSVYFSLAGSSIDFSLTQPAGTPSGNFSISSITPVDTNYYVAAFSLGVDGKIAVNFSAGAVLLATLQDAAIIGALFPNTNAPLGYVFLQYLTASKWRTAGSASAIIENAQIFRFGSGAGGGSGNDGIYNDDLISMLFRGKITDTFTESSSSPISTVLTAQTTATYISSKQMYQISYDATRTVTGTGSSMTLSGVPAFTVQVFDVLIIGNVAKVITNVGSINSDGGIATPFTISGSFSTDPVAAAACVSQKVKSKELYGTAFDGPTLYETFSGASFTEFLVDYEDSSAVDDNIFDISSPPVVAWAASGDNTVYTNNGVRPTLQTTTAQTTFLPAASTAFYIRFFANKTSGSGSVNLLDYSVYLQKDPTSAYGSQNSAICLSDNSATPVNCSTSVIGGKTRVVLNFPYAVGVSSGAPYGSLDVYMNGQIVPRYINGTITPSTAYTEINSTTIDFDKDYSNVDVEIEVIQRVTVTDTSTQNTSNIAILQSQRYIDNGIFNGDFHFSQLPSTSINTTASVQDWGPDMWAYYSLGTTARQYTISRDTSNAPTFAQSGYSYTGAGKVVSNAAHAFAAGDYIQPFVYNMEGYDFDQFNQQTVTFGFWVYSSIAGTYPFSLRNNGSTRSYVTTYTVNTINTWEYKSFTLTLDQSGTWDIQSNIGICVGLAGQAGTTYQAPTLNTWLTGNYVTHSSVTNFYGTSGATMYVTGVSMVVGTAGFGATYFRRKGKSRNEERMAFTRYYQSTYSGGTAPGSVTQTGVTSYRNPSSSGVLDLLTENLKVNMRSTPTITYYNPSTGASGSIRDTTNSADRTATTTNPTNGRFTVQASGMVSGSLNIWHYIADARLF